MPWHMHHLKCVRAESWQLHELTMHKVTLDFRRTNARRNERGEIEMGILIEVLLKHMTQHRHGPEFETHLSKAGDVIAMAMREDAEFGLQSFVKDEVNHRTRLVRTVHDPTGLPCITRVKHDKAIGREVTEFKALHMEGRGQSHRVKGSFTVQTLRKRGTLRSMRMTLRQHIQSSLASTMCAVVALCVGGCDTMGSDFSAFSASFMPPTPAEAATWAADSTDPENQRRGTLLLASAPWGGSSVYLDLYRLYVQEAQDPLVRAAAIDALGRHGDAADAALIAKQLASPFRQVKLASAKALQRLHAPAVADDIWPILIRETEDSDVRVELAIALAQYRTASVFQALVSALDHPELAVNVAASDSLTTMTAMDFGGNRTDWLEWSRSVPEIFKQDLVYAYPVFLRDKDAWDYMMFWNPVVFERPDFPAGMEWTPGNLLEATPPMIAP